MNEKSLIARIFLWKRFSSFTYLNTTQFLVVLNDSTFRLLVAFSLIYKLGVSYSSIIISVSGIVFVAPFLVFTMPAGELADKYSKQKVIIWSLVAEVIGMGYGIFAIYTENVVNAYAALFIVAVQSSVFTPSKYAILPEIVKPEEISRVNGMLTLATYVAIIIGSFLASFFTQVTDNNYILVAVFCFILALLGLFTSLQIEKTPVKNPTKKINPLFLVQVYKSLKLASKYPHLLLAVLASSYFMFMAAYTQLNVIPFGMQSLHITDAQAGYVFLVAALGIGVGSMIVAIISGKHVDLGIAIIGGFASSLSYIILYFFSNNIWMAVLMIFSLGLNGGLFIVPLDAYIQIASPEEDRGEIVASGTFLGFFGVLLASLSIGLFSDVFHISSAKGYLIIGLLSLTVSVFVLFGLPDYFTRFIATSFFRGFYKFTPINQPELKFYDTALIITKRYSFSIALALLQLYHRIAFIKFVKKQPSILYKPLYTLLHIIPYPVELPPEESNQILQRIYDKKMPLCLFLDGAFNFETDQKYEEIVRRILDQNNQPIIPLSIEGKRIEDDQKIHLNVFKNLPRPVSVTFGPKKEEKVVYSQAQELLDELNNKSR